MIESGDVLIIVHGMTTPDCRALLTFESKLTESQELKSIIDRNNLSFAIPDDAR